MVNRLHSAASAAASITGDESSQGGYALPIHDHQLESLTKQIATLEMKELNEKQRADHSDNKCKLLQVRKQIGTFWTFEIWTLYDILFPKSFLTTVRKNVLFSDREKLLKFEGGGQEFAKIFRSLKQFIQTVKGQNNFW